VVYVGYLFNPQGNVPNEEGYKGRRLFNYNDYYNAAAYIADEMRAANQEWDAIIAKTNVTAQ
jgi:hypothetical protein